MSTSFSVVIPTFNSAAYIEQTIKTVINQTYKNFEIVFSDDGSKDNTPDIIENFMGQFPEVKYKILRNPHQGPGATRNTGVFNATQEWIAFLDSDDHWMPEKLELMNSKILDTKCDLVFHNEQAHNVNTNQRSTLDHTGLLKRNLDPFISLYRENYLSPSATVLKKDLFIKAGGFDVTLPSAQDYDLWLRVSQTPNVTFETVNKELSIYTIRDGSITSNINKRFECMLKIYEKYKDQVKQKSPFPMYDLLRFKGRVFSVSGLRWFRTKEYLKGIKYISLGILLYPRFDWGAKALNKIIRPILGNQK